MDIGRTDGVQGPGGIRGPKPVNRIQPNQPVSGKPADSVEISEMARLVSEVTNLPKVRQEKIDEIRQMVDSGKYDTPERLAGALEQFLKENQDLS
ncbi:MAG: flagellar biosynthesis anti-sigma factor FlgM [Planctomycetota bacterium]|jgi:anti-sigma28 factor (negative regulator of flagellin synthesis)|nr:flagellar biosynthesis anti-sigma factor FlgM [Planctomycetota bacterium]